MNVEDISKDLGKAIEDRLTELYKAAEEKKSKEITKWERILNSKKNPNPDMEEMPYSEKDLVKKIKEIKSRSLVNYISHDRLEELSMMAQLKSSMEKDKGLLGRLLG